MSDKESSDFAKARLTARREMLKTSKMFMCACCQKEKATGEAAGVHLYRPEDVDIVKAMLDEAGRPKVATYVLCLECIDSFPEQVIHAKVTKSLAAEGLFGKPKVDS